jgi:hypothetical protein
MASAPTIECVPTRGPEVAIPTHESDDDVDIRRESAEESKRLRHRAPHVHHRRTAATTARPMTTCVSGSMRPIQTEASGGSACASQ